jgi:long-subunit acyl-CoA synthetase (AMP-forming)
VDVLQKAKDISIALSLGIDALGLAPSFEYEGKTWRTLGIQSKNRKEWCLINLGNMRQKITSVALYDT